MPNKNPFSTKAAREDSSRAALEKERKRQAQQTNTIETTTTGMYAGQKPKGTSGNLSSNSTLNQLPSEERKQVFSLKNKQGLNYAQEEKKLKENAGKVVEEFQRQAKSTVNYYDNPSRKADHDNNMNLQKSRSLTKDIDLYDAKLEHADKMIQKLQDRVYQYNNLNMLPEMQEAQADLERWYTRSDYLKKEVNEMERELRNEEDRLELERYEDYDIETSQSLLAEKQKQLAEQKAELQEQERSISGYSRARMFSEARAAEENVELLRADIEALETEISKLEEEIHGYERAAEARNSNEKQTEEVLRLATYDIEGGKERLAVCENELEKEEENFNRHYEDVQRYSNLNMIPEMQEAQTALEGSARRVEELKTEISQTKSDIYQAGLIQEDLEYTALMDKEGFEEMSETGRVEALRSSEDDLGIPNKKKYDYMSDEEEAIYHYLLAQDVENGTDTASEYLQHLTENLNARRGEDMGAQIREIENPVSRTLATGGYALASGASQFGHDLRQLTNEEVLPTTAMQYGSSYIRNDLRDIGPEIFGQSLGQIGYDLVENTAYVAPAMAVSAWNPIAGTAMASAASAGDAYNRAMRMGYSKADSRRYAAAAAGMEAAIPAAIGAGGSLVNKSLGKSIPHMIGSLPNSNARKIGQVLSTAVGEGFEGAAEVIADQAAQNVILGRNDKIDLLSDKMGYAVLSNSLAAPKSTRVPMADYADRKGALWNNVSANDVQSQRRLTAETHQRMLQDGNIVKISDNVQKRVNDRYSDVRKNGEIRGRRENASLQALESDIGSTLRSLKNKNYKFEVNGRTLEAKIYEDGMEDAVKGLTKEKAQLLMESDAVFRNAKYLYSTPDESGDPNSYRRNYFYTPVQVGDELVGVTLAIKDSAKSKFGGKNSQIVGLDTTDPQLWTGNTSKAVSRKNNTSHVPVGKNMAGKRVVGGSERRAQTAASLKAAQLVAEYEKWKKGKKKDWFLSGFNEDGE